jgi:hypothetical protein
VAAASHNQLHLSPVGSSTSLNAACGRTKETKIVHVNQASIDTKPSKSSAKPI